jgi:adenine/guanine/hypoxanthine permease
VLERVFRLQANGTTVRRELVAGVTTFAAMAYILAVNPMVLSDGTGMDRGALITATALASAIMTVLMALATNYPFALAPGMGLNAFFTYTLVRGAGIPWQAALGLVFYSGVLFLLLTVTGVRKRLIAAIPHELKVAISCGIGLFIAFIGLKNGGLVVKSDATLLTLGRLDQPATVLVLFGIILAAVLMVRRIPGGLMLTVLILTGIGFWIPSPTGAGMLSQWPEHGWISAPASLSSLFLKFDLGWFWDHWRMALPLVLTLLFVDVFDNLGTLLGLGQRVGYLDDQGNLPRLGRALTADAGAAMIGSALGTSTVTSYIESAAGIEAGGRTGLTAWVVSACFLMALVFSPVIALIPAAATAPILVVVGVFMMQSLTTLDLSDLTKAAPVVVTLLAMPLTFSIAEGLALGFVVYVGLMAGVGRAREVTPISWVLGVLFLLQLVTR